MRYLKIIIALLLVCPSSVWCIGVGDIGKLGNVVITPSADYSYITHFWTCDSATFDADDCSDGDTTPSASDAAAIDSVLYKAGSGSCDLYSAHDSWDFSTNPGNIVQGDNGRVGFYFYSTTQTAVAGLARVYYDASNYIWLRFDAASDEIEMIVQVGGSREVDQHSTAANLATATWYWLEAWWNATDNSVGFTVYSEAGAVIETVTDADAYTGWSGTTVIEIGEYVGQAGDTHIDNVIFSSSPATSLLDLRNLTSAPTGACDG